MLMVSSHSYLVLWGTKYACLLLFIFCSLIIWLGLLFVSHLFCFALIGQSFLFCFVFLMHWIRIHPSIYFFSLDNLPRSFSIVIYCVIPASMADVSPIDMVEISFTGMVNLSSSSMASCLASL